MKLDPVSLKYFVSVVEEGAIAAAAAREHIAAAAVSKRISELEATLRTHPVLIDRRPSRSATTPSRLTAFSEGSASSSSAP